MPGPLGELLDELVLAIDEDVRLAVFRADLQGVPLALADGLPVLGQYLDFKGAPVDAPDFLGFPLNVYFKTI